MKDASRETLEASRPSAEPLAAVTYCLKRLFLDESHRCSDNVSPMLTYEELIGALLHARDVIVAFNETPHPSE